MAMTTTSKGKLLATVFALVAIGLIVGSMVRGHPIDKRDLGDLYGCYVVDNQQLFRLTPDAVVTPTRSVPFTARQGRRYAYLDLASPMRVVHRGGALSFEPGPEPAVTIEVYRGSPRALLLQRDVGPPLKAIRTECRP
jgi:hypothetical protein